MRTTVLNRVKNLKDFGLKKKVSLIIGQKRYTQKTVYSKLFDYILHQ